jgi:site-specific DNA-methyltransferase (adenine-specific)
MRASSSNISTLQFVRDKLLVNAQPLRDITGRMNVEKESNKGIDGFISFIDNQSGQLKRVIVQIKLGHIQSADIRDLGSMMKREGTPIALFITFEEPSAAMLTEAAANGFYHSPGENVDYPALQILTIAELIRGAKIKMPPTLGAFKHI